MSNLCKRIPETKLELTKEMLEHQTDLPLQLTTQISDEGQSESSHNSITNGKQSLKRNMEN